MPKKKKPSSKVKKDSPILGEKAIESKMSANSIPEKKESVKEKEAPQSVAKSSLPKNEVQEYQDRVAQTREKLMNGPKVMFMVPMQPGEKPGAVETVNINGFKLTIQKGVMVEIPVAMAKVLANYLQVEMNAGSDKLIDRDESKKGIQVSDALQG